MQRSRAAVHGDSVRDVGQSRPRPDGGVARARRCGGAADAVSRPSRRPRTIAASPLPNGRGKNPRNIIDGEEPANSADSSAYFDWWPVQGSKSEWIEMTFAKPATVSESEVYWFDDTGRGGVRVPASWRLLYKNGDQWMPVETTQRVRRRAQRLERGRVHAGHDDGAPHRDRDAARSFRGPPGTEGQVDLVIQ